MPPQGCEGDEYVVSVSFESLETAEEESGTEILVQRLDGDGGESEFHLQGDLGDARALIGLLVAEGNCVEVEVEPPENGEPTPAASQLGIDPAELAPPPETALP
jgi:hypothetical protein